MTRYTGNAIDTPMYDSATKVQPHLYPSPIRLLSNTTHTMNTSQAIAMSMTEERGGAAGRDRVAEELDWVEDVPTGGNPLKSVWPGQHQRHGAGKDVRRRGEYWWSWIGTSIGSLDPLRNIGRAGDRLRALDTGDFRTILGTAG